MAESESDPNEKRKFTLRFEDGSERHKFTSEWPGHAALKAARKEIDPNGFTDPETAEEENSTRLYLREIGTRKLFVYKAWTWKHNHACPECGNRRVYRRKRKDPDYRCANCKAEFDTPMDASEASEKFDLDDDENGLPDYLDEDDLTEADVTRLGRSRVPDGERLTTPEEDS
ncbi:non-histone chromosomal MC1 family protein [Halorhabdus rudnickae]|uniref:non-histone chromosomal MC1 family protein n=1 Tax=Halorhabdus rudnickae TaxID=1775544 RepID=UPI0010828251|nr:non-histone chromosomal MC1 family protein [Halorhabdus rudnickae]